MLLKRVLGNLIKNARKASEPGGTVTAGCKPIDGEQVQFWVHNKTFMPRKVQLQVFQRSFTTKGVGRGLGTYSVRILTEGYLGGHNYFETAENDGTAFYITLPRQLSDSTRTH